MAPKKKKGGAIKQQAQAGMLPDADNLMAFLETTLAHLELVSGEQDAESKAMLEQLRATLAGVAAPVPGQPREMEMNEEQMEAFLENIDKQLGTLESTLANADDTTNQFLTASLQHWGAGEDAQGGPSGVQDDAARLDAVQEEEAQGEGQHAGSAAVDGSMQGACSTAQEELEAGSLADGRGGSVPGGADAPLPEAGAADSMDLFASIAARMGAGS